MKPYFQYKLMAESEGDGKKNTVYPRIASLMERDFLDAINQPKFTDWVETHRAEFEAGISPMKVYVAEHLSSFRPTLMTEELDILRKATRHVAGVITTNYDGLMESAFPKYDVYVRQEDLLFPHGWALVKSTRFMDPQRIPAPWLSMNEITSNSEIIRIT